MNHGLWVLALGLAIGAPQGIFAQDPMVSSPDPVIASPLVANGAGSWYEPPGHYGTSYGVPSFGVPRIYTAFSSPYGAGYGYGYGPYVTGLNWLQLQRGTPREIQPGFSVPGYFYGGSLYNTFPVPYSIYGPPSPPIGVYAPAFGPPIIGD
jgi:hypothetical protein